MRIGEKSNVYNNLYNILEYYFYLYANGVGLLILLINYILLNSSNKNDRV